MPVLPLFLAAAVAGAQSGPAVDPATRAAIEATCFDYLDGQLEGDPARVARALHPDLAKRRVLGATADETLGLRRMGRDELVELTRQGVLKIPRDQWDRSCTVLDVAGEAEVVRAETPWLVDFLLLGRCGGRWVIVIAVWYTTQAHG